MVGLLDIADPETENVTVRKADVPVNAITIKQIAVVLGRFEELEAFFKEGAMATLSIGMVAKIAPDAVAAIIAIGTGYGDAEPDLLKAAEKKAASLNPGEQFAIVKKMLELSFGDQLGPLIARLAALADARKEEGEPVVPGKALPMSSLRALRKSLVSTTTPEMFGATHHGNSPATPS
jgi:hypothetical protein